MVTIIFDLNSCKSEMYQQISKYSKYFRFNIFLTAIISILFCSCEAGVSFHDIYNDINLEPSAILPVGNVSVTMGQFLSKNINNTSIDFSDPIEINYIRNDSAYLSFNGLNFTDTIIYGNLNPNITASGEYTQTWNFNKYFPGSLLKLSNPKVDVTLTSNIGTYLNFRIDSIEAFVSDNASITPTYAWFNNHSTNTVTDQFDSKPKIPGTWVTKKLRTFDRNWGEINNIFANSNQYDRVRYKFSAWVNQTMVQNDPSPGFITKSQTIKVNIKTTVPFHLDKGSYIHYADTIPGFSNQLSSAFNINNNITIDTAIIVLKIKNGLPVNTQLSLNFVDSIGQHIQTNLTQNFLITSGQVDANGIVQNGKESDQIVLIPVPKSQLAVLEKVKSVVFDFLITGENIDSNIYFTKSNTLNIDAGLYLKSSLKFNRVNTSQK
jgi:hypothetical protein